MNIRLLGLQLKASLERPVYPSSTVTIKQALEKPQIGKFELEDILYGEKGRKIIIIVIIRFKAYTKEAITKI